MGSRAQLKELHMIKSIAEIYGGNETDSLALLSIKSNLQDPLGVLTSWNSSVHFCQWQGVTCGRRHRRVTGLILRASGLVGPLSPFIGNLSFLKEIRLTNNSLQGEIPPQIGRLLRLQVLVLDYNSFEGKIPAILSYCTSLVILSAAENKLVGEIPRELSTMTKLALLSFSANNLRGGIPSSIGNLTSLESLGLSYNFLEGSIPDALGGLRNIKVLAFGVNKLSGTVPSFMYNISSLILFSLSNNQFGGSLQKDLGLNLPRLQRFEIRENNFSGTIPVYLSNASALSYIDFSNNSFMGKVPTNFGSLELLRVIGLEYNSLGSWGADDMSFLSSLANCSELEQVGVNFNQLGGVLPNVVGNFSIKLRYFGVAYNQISGIIPPELSNLVNLERLGMAYNQFEGQIPDNIGKLQKLVVLNIASNRLTGQIPSSVGNLSFLSNVELDDNRLEGIIPSSLGNCKLLILLNISQNNLSGTIPKELFSASSLSISLNLARNHLAGLVPREIGNLRNLGELDLSENRLSGEIPSELGRCISLVRLLLGGNFFKGSIPSSFESLRGIQILDLSSNNLSGTIPIFLGDFSLKSLNLSFNDFEGELPTKGVYANGSVISVVGNNRLCGGISSLQLPTCHTATSPQRRLSNLHIILITTGCLLLFVSITSSFIFCWFKKKRRVQSSGILLEESSFLKVSYGELFKVTDGFSSTNLIGVGGFGSVYKGILDREQMTVAIKVLKLEHQGASKSFLAECKALRNIRHRNLVKLMTSCSSIDFQGNEFKALIYEFMPNGSLERWLHSIDETQTLDLHQRINIAIDVASALDYLHHHCENPILHCDLKPNNVLLDKDMVARLGDFGLARFLLVEPNSANQSKTIEIEGTIGYVAPEYGLGSQVSMNGDVYSYGIILLEMITGRSPVDPMFDEGLNLHNYARKALPDHVMEIVNPKLLSNDEEEEELKEVDNKKFSKHSRNGISNEEEVALKEADNKKSSKQSRNGNILEDCLIAIVKIGVACSMESPHERMDIDDAIHDLHLARDILEELYCTPPRVPTSELPVAMLYMWPPAQTSHRLEPKIKRLHGSLSPFIGNHRFLKEIRLQNNSRQGEIPPQIGRLFRFQSLHLYNNLEGKIPLNLSHCISLMFLSAAKKQID
ncbi:hypothetical protein LguiB_014196 [Lonicera macranthoides]